MSGSGPEGFAHIHETPNGDDAVIVKNPQGERIMLSIPKIPDDAPELVREGIARRRITAIEGRCPCGAVMKMPDRAARRRMRRTGEVFELTIEHEDDCPAITENIIAAMGDWRPAANRWDEP